jgi:hypothetical protein
LKEAVIKKKRKRKRKRKTKVYFLFIYFGGEGLPTPLSVCPQLEH